MRIKVLLLVVVLFTHKAASASNNGFCLCPCDQRELLGDPPLGNITQMIADGVYAGLLKAGPDLIKLLENWSLAKAAMTLSEYVVNGRYITAIDDSEISKALVAGSNYIVQNGYALPVTGVFAAGCLAVVAAAGASQYCLKSMWKPHQGGTRMSTIRRVTSGSSDDTQNSDDTDLLNP